MSEHCRLCGGDAEFFHQDTQKYLRCSTCRAIFTAAADLVDSQSEQERYELHTTEIDAGYKKFVSPITSRVIADFSQEAKGLDFGAGRSQIISYVLRENNYTIANYDPFFINKPELLEQKYDYITSCEVIEHFYEPAKEFTLLNSMLQENGKLYLMTDLYDESIDFAAWYYKNDPTHVFFYTKESLEWIQKTYNFKNLFIEKRFILLEK